MPAVKDRMSVIAKKSDFIGLTPKIVSLLSSHSEAIEHTSLAKHLTHGRIGKFLLQLARCHESHNNDFRKPDSRIENPLD
jgi:hypothetical protein